MKSEELNSGTPAYGNARLNSRQQLVHGTKQAVFRYHATQGVRGLDEVARSSVYQGRFGRMFRHLSPFLPETTDLQALAATMIQLLGANGEEIEDEEHDNDDIAAGYTYLGQFIDHDITFDPNSQLQRDNDPNALNNFRTPRFDLDSLYGDGPSDNPFLYREDNVRLLVGTNEAGEEDLPRNAPQGGERARALTGDPRNDENLIISQLQLAFIKFHNRVVDELEGKVDDDLLLDEARRIVRWHYQWVVIHDFLELIVGKEIVDDILKVETYKIMTSNGAKDARTAKVDLKFYDWRNKPFMPVEFSVAAYRFGHSMIRPDYELNEDDQNIPIFREPPDANSDLGDLRGFRMRPANRQIQWHRFFEFQGEDPPQKTRLIDTRVEHGLGHLPPSVASPPVSLAERNLRRGKALGLPSGQAVARAMGIPDDLILDRNVLSQIVLGNGGSLSDDLLDKFGENTPLWYYILAEAETEADGKKLGPVGGRIVAEVLIGLLSGDPMSYLGMQPTWTPASETVTNFDENFDMVDLLTFAGVPL